CAVNPQCLREDDYQVLPANEKKSVLVIGGGPGGMQAAITAAQRGFDVELWEKEPRLGGTLLAAGAPSFKKDVLRYVTYLCEKITRSKVKVKLNKEANADEILRSDFDKVIIATGAKAFMPPINGIDSQNVKDAVSVLLGNEGTGKNVVVIGGGLVGCETALHINESAIKVTIIEMLDDILVTAEHNHNNDLKLRKMIAKSGIDIICNAKVTSLNAGYVEYSENNETKRINCDTVVIAAGFKSDNSFVQALEDKIEDLSVIGDAIAPRKVYDAVHEGFHTARLI
ncbi:MAG: FAD-dependent oxidoreductase, partial [Syntrophomonadaceae bacterium]|nr:FAD-dependent oxidoreductase [Syntrophomonadaceae bacterium]